MRDRQMRPWVSMHRGDVRAILIGIALLVLFLIAAITIQNRSNAGFGPDWDCTSVPRGDSVCVKKVPADKKTAPLN